MACRQISSCPLFISKGNEFHASNKVNILLFEESKNYLFSASYTDTRIMIWDYLSGRLITNFRGHEGYILSMKFFEIPISWKDY
jgi:WD40 repeat protein